MSAQTKCVFDTGHTDSIQDAQLDYYGKRLATCASDHIIRIWDVSSAQASFVAELKGHTGPVWQVAWAHPRFGNILGTCSYDKKVIIWKEVRQGSFEPIHEYTDHIGSVNTITFGPEEVGLHVICGSSDGWVSVLSYCNGRGMWDRNSFETHTLGVNAVCCSPCLGTPDGTMKTVSIVTGGRDNRVCLWNLNPTTNTWEESLPKMPPGHRAWVRDVVWQPSTGATQTIVTCGNDKEVLLWTRENQTAPWKVKTCTNLSEKCIRASWSMTGDLLAVATAHTHTHTHTHVCVMKEASPGTFVPLLA
eukprot:GHVR01131974.1.p1 GENE.GHVR01131974.1~~GHVR01131974.1.p1  ORF type:complete len:304 (-),score=103.40 GHVR01131974.1:79-990(-)